MVAPETVIEGLFGKVKCNCRTELTVVSNPKDRSGCPAWIFFSPHGPKMAAVSLDLTFSQCVSEVKHQGGGQGSKRELLWNTYFLLSERHSFPSWLFLITPWVS